MAISKYAIKPFNIYHKRLLYLSKKAFLEIDNSIFWEYTRSRYKYYISYFLRELWHISCKWALGIFSEFKLGDEIIFKTITNEYRYKIINMKVVNPKDYLISKYITTNLLLH